MKFEKVNVFDDKDCEFAESLMCLGFDRRVATVITYLANVGWALSIEIERSTDLTQPDVSKAMRTLRESNWVVESEAKRMGTGRSIKIYSLSSSVAEILTDLEKEKRQESAKTMEYIQRLRKMMSS